MYYRLSVICLLLEKGVYPECQFTLNVLPFVSYLSVCCLTRVISVLFSLFCCCLINIRFLFNLLLLLSDEYQSSL